MRTTETVDVCATPAPASGDPGELPLAPLLVVQKIEMLRIGEWLVVVFGAVGCVFHLEPLSHSDISYG